MTKAFDVHDNKELSGELQKFIEEQRYRHELSKQQLRVVMNNLEQFFERYIRAYDSRWRWEGGLWGDESNEVDQSMKIKIKGHVYGETFPISKVPSQVGRSEAPAAEMNASSNASPYHKMKSHGEGQKNNYNSPKTKSSGTPVQKTVAEINTTGRLYSMPDSKPKFTRAYYSNKQVFGFSNRSQSSSESLQEGVSNAANLQRTINKLLEKNKQLQDILQETDRHASQHVRGTGSDAKGNQTSTSALLFREEKKSSKENQMSTSALLVREDKKNAKENQTSTSALLLREEKKRFQPHPRTSIIPVPLAGMPHNLESDRTGNSTEYHQAKLTGGSWNGGLAKAEPLVVMSHDLESDRSGNSTEYQQAKLTGDPWNGGLAKADHLAGTPHNLDSDQTGNSTEYHQAKVIESSWNGGFPEGYPSLYSSPVFEEESGTRSSGSLIEYGSTSSRSTNSVKAQKDVQCQTPVDKLKQKIHDHAKEVHHEGQATLLKPMLGKAVCVSTQTSGFVNVELCGKTVPTRLQNENHPAVMSHSRQYHPKEQNLMHLGVVDKIGRTVEPQRSNQYHSEEQKLPQSSGVHKNDQKTVDMQRSNYAQYDPEEPNLLPPRGVHENQQGIGNLHHYETEQEDSAAVSPDGASEISESSAEESEERMEENMFRKHETTGPHSHEPEGGRDKEAHVHPSHGVESDNVRSISSSSEGSPRSASEAEGTEVLRGFEHFQDLKVAVHELSLLCQEQEQMLASFEYRGRADPHNIELHVKNLQNSSNGLVREMRSQLDVICDYLHLNSEADSETSETSQSSAEKDTRLTDDKYVRKHKENHWDKNSALDKDNMQGMDYNVGSKNDYKGQCENAVQSLKAQLQEAKNNVRNMQVVVNEVKNELSKSEGKAEGLGHALPESKGMISQTQAKIVQVEIGTELQKQVDHQRDQIGELISMNRQLLRFAQTKEDELDILQRRVTELHQVIYREAKDW